MKPSSDYRDYDAPNISFVGVVKSIEDLPKEASYGEIYSVESNDETGGRHGDYIWVGKWVLFAQSPTDERMDALEDVLADALSALENIEYNHGKLPGVDWRILDKIKSALFERHQ